MLARYKTDDSGRLSTVAKVYTENEHPIRNSNIDQEALSIVYRLQKAGHEAYIVGGSLRDMMLGRKPKDFDISTSASPRQIYKLFWNSRIVGKRFKLVHIFFGEKIYEISTFRSSEADERKDNNIYGSIEDDAKRRDFTINSLYYNPFDCSLLDFNGGMEDFAGKRIVSVIPLSKSFRDDPVRMIRAVKYSATTGFKMNPDVRLAIHLYAKYLSGASTSRLTEEVNKILHSGESRLIFQRLDHYGLLGIIMPTFSMYIGYPEVVEALDEYDLSVKNGTAENGDGIRALARKIVSFPPDVQMTSKERFEEVFRQIKVLMAPITPPNHDVDLASAKIMKELGYRSPKNCTRQKKEKPKSGVARRKKPKATPVQSTN